MLRRVLTALSCCLCMCLRAQDVGSMSITGDRTEFLERQNETIMTGHAVVRQGDLLVTGDQLRYRGPQGTNPVVITVTGHVVFTQGPLRLLAERVELDRTHRSFAAEHVRLGSYPYYVEGQSATGSRDQITVTQARISYGEPGPWQPTATAEKLVVFPATHEIRTEGSQLGIGHAQPVPLPHFQQSLSDPLLSFVTLTGGYRGSLGAYVDGGVHLPVAPGFRLGGDLGYFTARGLMLGPSGTYSDPNNADRLNGIFRSGYINDHGDKGTDLLGRSVPENRGFVTWQHQQLLTDDLSLTGQLNWWKDSEVLRDFRPRAFFPLQQPDTSLEATYASANFFVSVFGRFEPNSFEIVQQRLPEIRFDLLPLAVGGGIYERFNASIAALREDPLPPASVGPQTETGYIGRIYPSWTTISPLPLGATAPLRSTRFDAYYSLSRPIAPNDWFTVTPVAGGRITRYADTKGAMVDGSYTRALGEVGADAELRASGIFNYKNETWHIDGLRHLFTPRISYRYIPEADRGQAHIPLIDRDVFSTYLPPLDLGDQRNVDQLHATNTLRLELDNTLQTRDPQYGSRDLLTFDVANDFRFKRSPGERDVSEIHTELAAMPTRWLSFGLYNRTVPQSVKLQELDTAVTLHDGDAWMVRFGNNFLRHQQLEDYLLDARVRVNEEFEAVTQLRYDQHGHRFTEQAYGVVQNLANTWRISYLVSLYSGRRRESPFGFNIQIDTVRF